MDALDRALALSLLLGVVGGVVGYAASVYVSRVYVLVTQPAAEVKTYTLRIERAPYQTFEYYLIQLASVEQRSDRVRYTVRVEPKNVSLYKVCLWVGFFMTTYYSECIPPDQVYSFVIERGRHSLSFSVYANIYGKTTGSNGEIAAIITYEAVA